MLSVGINGNGVIIVHGQGLLEAGKQRMTLSAVLSVVNTHDIQTSLIQSFPSIISTSVNDNDEIISQLQDALHDIHHRPCVIVGRHHHADTLLLHDLLRLVHL